MLHFPCPLSWIQPEGAGKPRSACPPGTENWAPLAYHVPESQILNLLVIWFWLGEEGAVLQWQDLAFLLCLMHFPSVSCRFPEVWATHQSRSICFPWRFNWSWLNSLAQHQSSKSKLRPLSLLFRCLLPGLLGHWSRNTCFWWFAEGYSPSSWIALCFLLCYAVRVSLRALGQAGSWSSRWTEPVMPKVQPMGEQRVVMLIWWGPLGQNNWKTHLSSLPHCPRSVTPVPRVGGLEVPSRPCFELGYF